MSRYQGIIRPVWAEIDLKAITHNLQEVRRLVGPTVAIMAVVKAEAYGHGAVEIAKTTLNAGANWLGVSLPEEGIALRKAGITAPILIFGPLQPDQVSVVLKYDLTATVCQIEAAVALSREATRFGKLAELHVKVDTGMGRVGVRPEEAVRFISKIDVLPGLKVTGLYSHLATADEAKKEYANTQIKQFSAIVTTLKTVGKLPPLIHLANSAAIIDLPDSYFTMVRPGIMLYGLYPSAEVKRDQVNLQPALALKAKTSFAKQVATGTGISYGQRYHTGDESNIVTIPIGYADGWSRLLTNKAQALYGGKKYPIVGTICMDQCMIDLGSEPGAVGAEVVLIGGQGAEQISADDVAALLGTINYEVTCMISDRVPRIYLKL